MYDLFACLLPCLFAHLLALNVLVMVIHVCTAVICFVSYVTGVVDNILSWKGWFPLSRLTYCAYLLHPVVLMVYIGTLKEVIHIDHLHMVRQTVL